MTIHDDDDDFRFRFGSDDDRGGKKSHFYYARFKASRVGKSIFVREIAFQTALTCRARTLSHLSAALRGATH
jgi:hypothetical protein